MTTKPDKLLDQFIPAPRPVEEEAVPVIHLVCCRKVTICGTFSYDPQWADDCDETPVCLDCYETSSQVTWRCPYCGKRTWED